MGFSFKKIGSKIFSKRGLQSFLGSAGGLLPGVQEFMLTDKGNEIYEGIHKGLGNLVSGGYLGQKEATEEARKARDEAAKRYQAEIDAANAEAARIANIEEERKKRLALYGTKNPSTLIGGYLGVGGGASTSRPTLG